jgi:hypothetical protein
MDGRIIPPSNTPAHQGKRRRIVALIRCCTFSPVVVEARVFGAEDGIRTDDAVVTTTGPARRDYELPIADAYISPAAHRGGQ